MLTLAKEHDLEPVERQVPLDELLGRAADGSLVELFAAGTAAVITPITSVRTEDGPVRIGDGKPGPRSAALRRHIVDVQFGRRPDEHGWLQQV